MTNPANKPHEVSAAQAKCANCQELVDADQLEEISGFPVHPAPGEMMPVGQCPSCSGPCHPVKSPRVAQTSDGYKFSEQSDGTWSDGDMTFDSLEQLLEQDPDTLIDGKPVLSDEKPD